MTGALCPVTLTAHPHLHLLLRCYYRLRLLPLLQPSTSAYISYNNASSFSAYVRFQMSHGAGFSIIYIPIVIFSFLYYRLLPLPLYKLQFSPISFPFIPYWSVASLFAPPVPDTSPCLLLPSFFSSSSFPFLHSYSSTHSCTHLPLPSRLSFLISHPPSHY